MYFENDYLVNDRNISKIIQDCGAKFIFLAKRKPCKIYKEILRLFSETALEKLLYKNDFYFALKLLKRTKNLDLVHLNNHFSSNLAYNHAANRLEIKVIQHLRKNSTIENFKLNILKKLKFCPISVSNSTYEFYNQMLKIDKNIIYNPVVINKKIKDLRELDKINIAYIANFLPFKGHELVFDAFLALERDDIRLILAGNGKLSAKAEEKFLQLNQNGKAINMGFVEDIETIFYKSDFVLGFSTDEGLPRVVIEGLGMGCGIIFSDISVVREIYDISSHKSIFHIVKRDANSLLECLKNLKKPKSKSQDEAIIDKFSFNEYVSKVVNLYETYKK